MGASRFFLRGDVDLVSAPTVREEFRRIVDASRGDVVIDCFDVTFLDASGVGLLVELKEALSRQGRAVRLANVRDFAARVLSAVELYDEFSASPVDHDRDRQKIIEWAEETREQSRRLCMAARALCEDR